MVAQRPVGPYLVESRLASGGMAEVFVARKVGPHGFAKRVALKRILPQFAKDPDFVAMFIDEARLAARLAHPSIVQVFDFGELGGDLFLAMELVEGTNVNRLLRTVASKASAVPADVALEIAAQTARALAYAHGLRDEAGAPLGIVHRDVSPANLLLARTGHVKLSDFGIARAASVEHRTDEGRLRGKLGYMSPEQVLGRPLDGRSDVFTLATVLAEMLIAEPLFGTGTDLDVMLRIRDVDLRVLRDTDKRVPAEVRRLLTLGLERDPRNRPEAGEFADAIAVVQRRRGGEGGADKVARTLLRLGLITSPTGQEVSPEATATRRSLAPVDDPAVFRLYKPEAETAVQGGGATSPAIWHVRLGDGRALGPLSFPKLVELITTGVLDARAEVARGDSGFQSTTHFPELTRFITSPGLRWQDDAQADAAEGDQGELAPARLLSVVHRICVGHRTGVLHLGDGVRRKKIYFVDGRPEFVASTDKRELLGEYLVARGLVLRMEVEMALALLPRYGGRLGDALVGLGVLRPMELFRAITDQVVERYLEAFRWTRGRWRFVEGARSHEETFPLGRDGYELARDAVARLHPAELDAALDPLGERLLHRAPDPAVGLGAFRVPETWRRVVETVDGQHTVAMILAQEAARGVDPDEVMRALVLATAVGLVSAEERTSRAPPSRPSGAA